MSSRLLLPQPRAGQILLAPVAAPNTGSELARPDMDAAPDTALRTARAFGLDERGGEGAGDDGARRKTWIAMRNRRIGA